jgi:hypothetical protein
VALDEVENGATWLRAIINKLIAEALTGNIAAIRESSIVVRVAVGGAAQH